MADDPSRENEEEAEFSALITPPDEMMRVIGLYGSITEENAAGCVFQMLSMMETGRKEKVDDAGNPTGITVCEPFDVIICSPGGSVDDMFAIYDTMKHVQESGCEIGTIGIGRVCSAGVSILVGGSPGKRRISKNCRIMVHNMFGAIEGELTQMNRGCKELQKQQEKYLEIICENSKLKKASLKRMIKRQGEVFFTSAEAIKYGIVDELF